MFIGCAMFNTTGTPWYQDIKNWSSYQKANFFMNSWLAEENGYNTLNEMPDKPESLVESLNIKRKVLETSRMPIRMYVQLVSQGKVPSAESEQQIINWLRELQMQYIYGGK